MKYNSLYALSALAAIAVACADAPVTACPTGFWMIDAGGTPICAALTAPNGSTVVLADTLSGQQAAIESLQDAGAARSGAVDGLQQALAAQQTETAALQDAAKSRAQTVAGLVGKVDAIVKDALWSGTPGGPVWANASKVGIGTATPTHQLDLSGDVGCATVHAAHAKLAATLVVGPEEFAAAPLAAAHISTNTQNEALTLGSSWDMQLSLRSAKAKDAVAFLGAQDDNTFAIRGPSKTKPAGDPLFTVSLDKGNVKVAGSLQVPGDVTCGKVVANSVTTLDPAWSGSDARLKTAISPIRDALAKILQLRGVTFHWRDKGRDTGEQVGLIAQEVERVLPQLVMTGADGFKAVAYANLVAVLVEAVRTQHGDIEQLRAENAVLHATLAALERRLAKLEAKAALVRPGSSSPQLRPRLGGDRAM